MEPFDVDEDSIGEVGSAVGSGLQAEFDAAWAESTSASANPFLVPSRLAEVCQRVLAVDAAGLSMLQDDFRLPLGASDPQAVTAEQLQFTQGEGPCLDAVRRSQAMVADEVELQRRWPMFAQALLARTRFRAVVSVPLNLPSRAALDLYLVEHARVHELRLADVLTVAELAAHVFRVEMDSPPPGPNAADDDHVPVMLMSPSVQSRQVAWVAAGMIMQRYGVTASDAVALLRSYAYANDSVVDAVAAGLVDGTVALGALQP